MLFINNEKLPKSYFIKDIKDATELAFYKQVNNNDIQIFYKDELIYSLNDYSCNYINNISKQYYYKYIESYKICSNYMHTVKYLFYKKDNTIDFPSSSYIKVNFIYNKYFNKIRLFYVSIIYSNCYKYITTYNY